jgi:hypothetical protein
VHPFILASSGISLRFRGLGAAFWWRTQPVLPWTCVILMALVAKIATFSRGTWDLVPACRGKNPEKTCIFS